MAPTDGIISGDGQIVDRLGKHRSARKPPRGIGPVAYGAIHSWDLRAIRNNASRALRPDGDFRCAPPILRSGIPLKELANTRVALAALMGIEREGAVWERR